MHAEDNENLHKEAELIIKALEVCSNEKRYFELETLAKSIILPLASRGVPKALWLKSKLSNLGEADVISESDFDQLWLNLVKEAAAGGCVEAQYEFACHLYEAGDYSQATDLYRLSADKGYPPAQWCIGLQLFHGNYIPKDINEGLAYIRLSAGMRYEYAVEFLVSQLPKENGIKCENGSEVEMWKRSLGWLE